MNVICCTLSCAALVAASSAVAEEKLPEGVALITPDKMQWVKTPSGRELAYLHGHPDKPGLTKGEGAVLYFYGVGPSGNVALEK